MFQKIIKTVNKAAEAASSTVSWAWPKKYMIASGDFSATASKQKKQPERPPQVLEGEVVSREATFG